MNIKYLLTGVGFFLFCTFLVAGNNSEGEKTISESCKRILLEKVEKENLAVYLEFTKKTLSSLKKVEFMNLTASQREFIVDSICGIAEKAAKDFHNNPEKIKPALDSFFREHAEALSGLDNKALQSLISKDEIFKETVLKFFSENKVLILDPGFNRFVLTGSWDENSVIPPGALKDFLKLSENAREKRTKKSLMSFIDSLFTEYSKMSPGLFSIPPATAGGREKKNILTYLSDAFIYTTPYENIRIVIICDIRELRASILILKTMRGGAKTLPVVTSMTQAPGIYIRKSFDRLYHSTGFDKSLWRPAHYGDIPSRYLVEDIYKINSLRMEDPVIIYPGETYGQSRSNIFSNRVCEWVLTLFSNVKKESFLAEDIAYDFYTGWAAKIYQLHDFYGKKRDNEILLSKFERKLLDFYRVEIKKHPILANLNIPQRKWFKRVAKYRKTAFVNNPVAKKLNDEFQKWLDKKYYDIPKDKRDAAKLYTRCQDLFSLTLIKAFGMGDYPTPIKYYKHFAPTRIYKLHLFLPDGKKRYKTVLDKKYHPFYEYYLTALECHNPILSDLDNDLPKKWDDYDLYARYIKRKMPEKEKKELEKFILFLKKLAKEKENQVD